MKGRPERIDKLMAQDIGLALQRVFIILGRDLEVEIDEMEIRTRVSPRTADHFDLPDGPLRVKVFKHGVCEVEEMKRIDNA